MKTTIEIADDLLARAKQLCRRERRTLRAVVEDGLRLVVKRESGTPPRRRNPLAS